MRRTVRELVDAAFAGETITPQEIESVVGLPITNRSAVAWDLIGHSAMRAAILRQLDTYTVEDCRETILVLVLVLGYFIDQEAGREDHDHDRRMDSRDQGRRGGRSSGDTRRENREIIRETIQTNVDGPITRAGVKQYLEKYDSSWASATDEERRHLVEKLMRRLRASQPTRR